LQISRTLEEIIGRGDESKESKRKRGDDYHEEDPEGAVNVLGGNVGTCKRKKGWRVGESRKIHEEGEKSK